MHGHRGNGPCCLASMTLSGLLDMQDLWSIFFSEKAGSFEDGVESTPLNKVL